jgi:arginase
MKKVSIIGAPTDIGAGTRGASMGPEALRVARLQSMLESQGVEVADRGNLQGPGNPGLPPVEGYRHLPQVVAWNRAVFDACRAEYAAARLPILVGGDHCLAIGSIAAAAQHAHASGRKLRVLWFDAHADANTNVLTPSGNIHGMPVAILLGHGPKQLVEIAGKAPVMQPRSRREALRA